MKRFFLLFLAIMMIIGFSSCATLQGVRSEPASMDSVEFMDAWLNQPFGESKNQVLVDLSDKYGVFDYINMGGTIEYYQFTQPFNDYIIYLQVGFIDNETVTWNYSLRFHDTNLWKQYASRFSDYYNSLPEGGTVSYKPAPNNGGFAIMTYEKDAWAWGMFYYEGEYRQQLERWKLKPKGQIA